MQKKVQIFKQEVNGKAKATGKPFRFVELHDPETLDNTKYFIDPSATLETAFPIHTPVEVTYDIVPDNFGKPSITLASLKKVSNG